MKKTKTGEFSKIKNFWKKLGPGIVTGASDDDPSGIATYSQAGAGFGLSTLWTALITFPLMASIEEMCARIGIVKSQGLTGIIKRNYPKTVLYIVVLLSFPALILNIGADIAGMGAVANLLFPQIPIMVFSVFITALLIVTLIHFSYRKIASVMKWLCIVLLAYFIVPFLAKQNWLEILKNTFIPTIKFDRNFLSILVAILGTTISPYLFFWQASMEVEEMNHKKKRLLVNKKILNDMVIDVDFGMFFSNVAMFFIILTAGTVLFSAGIRQIDTVEQAAQALRPLAGNLAYLLFAVGVIGTGFITVPVLAGSLSYIYAEVFGIEEGLDKKFHKAKGFYMALIVSLVAGLLINFIGISPIKILIYTAVLYGLIAPILIAVILHICNNKKIMGDYANGFWSNILGFATLIFMASAVAGLLYLQFAS